MNPKKPMDFDEFFHQMARTTRWDDRYLELAHLVATWSKDPSSKVGAVAVSPDNRVLSTGFNGFLPGADDFPELYLDREYKYKHVIHAEINALGRAVPTAKGSTLYVTFPPCPTCARAIVAAGVKRVVTLPVPLRLDDLPWTVRWVRSFDESLGILQGNGVAVHIRPDAEHPDWLGDLREAVREKMEQLENGL